MTPSESSVVVADTNEVVGSRWMVAVDDVGRHVEPMGREFDQRVQLVAQRPRVREPFQVDDEHVGQRPLLHEIKKSTIHEKR